MDYHSDFNYLKDIIEQLILELKAVFQTCSKSTDYLNMLDIIDLNKIYINIIEKVCDEKVPYNTCLSIKSLSTNFKWAIKSYFQIRHDASSEEIVKFVEQLVKMQFHYKIYHSWFCQFPKFWAYAGDGCVSEEYYEKSEKEFNYVSDYFRNGVDDEFINDIFTDILEALDYFGLTDCNLLNNWLIGSDNPFYCFDYRATLSKRLHEDYIEGIHISNISTFPLNLTIALSSFITSCNPSMNDALAFAKNMLKHQFTNPMGWLFQEHDLLFKVSS